MFDGFQAQYPALSESKLSSIMTATYDETAKVLAEKIADLKDSVKAYTDCPVDSDSDPDEVTAYFKEHKDKSQAAWSTAGVEYSILKEIPYEDSDLADIVTNDDYDFTGAEDRMVLYPMIEAMSPGQRALLPYTDLGQMLIFGNLSEEDWEQTAQKTANSIKDSVPVSVYAGVDRSLFQPAGIALTSQARKIQSATGASYNNKLLGIDRRCFELAALGNRLHYEAAFRLD